jgi:hypothetical protein
LAILRGLKRRYKETGKAPILIHTVCVSKPTIAMLLNQISQLQLIVRHGCVGRSG